MTTTNDNTTPPVQDDAARLATAARNLTVACLICGRSNQSHPMMGSTDKCPLSEGMVYRYVIASRDALVDRQAQEIVSLRDNLESANDCLSMVHERLASVLGEESMKGTPAMFYPEAITTALYRAHKGTWGTCKDADCLRCNGQLEANARLGAALRPELSKIEEAVRLAFEINRERYAVTFHVVQDEMPLIEQTQEGK